MPSERLQCSALKVVSIDYSSRPVRPGGMLCAYAPCHLHIRPASHMILHSCDHKRWCMLVSLCMYTAHSFQRQLLPLWTLVCDYTVHVHALNDRPSVLAAQCKMPAMLHSHTCCRLACECCSAAERLWPRTQAECSNAVPPTLHKKAAPRTRGKSLFRAPCNLQQCMAADVAMAQPECRTAGRAAFARCVTAGTPW
jgi:hypothetical protein